MISFRGTNETEVEREKDWEGKGVWRILLTHNIYVYEIAFM